MIWTLLSAVVAITASPASDTVTIDAAGVDATAIASELRLRSPNLRVIEEGDPVSEGATVLHVRARAQEYELVLVLDDGRIFRRTVPAQPQHGPRVVATALANLLAGVAEGQLVADEDPRASMVPEPIDDLPLAPI